MKKWALAIVLILGGIGVFSIKYNTTLLDSKNSATIINKHYPFKEDYQDKQKLIEAVDHIFIGEVIREVGTEEYAGTPNTQFLVRITQNMKGALLGDITVNQAGGYYKEKGKLYLLSYEKTPLLKKKQMYIFFLTRTNKDYFEMMPKYGSFPLDNEEEKLKEMDALRKVMAVN